MTKKGVSKKTNKKALPKTKNVKQTPVWQPPATWDCWGADRQLNFKEFIYQAMKKAKIAKQPARTQQPAIPIVNMFPGALSPIWPLTKTGCFPPFMEIACIQPCKVAAWCEAQRLSSQARSPVQCRKLGDLFESRAPSAIHGGRMIPVKIPTDTIVLGKLTLPSKPHALIGSTEQNAIDAMAFLQKFQPQAAILDISGIASKHAELFKALAGFSVSRAASTTAAFGLPFFPAEKLEILLVIRDGLGSGTVQPAVQAGKLLHEMVCKKPFHVQSFLNFKGTA